MTPTPVGMRCPECSNQRTKVVRPANAFGTRASAPATRILIAINVIAFLVEVAVGADLFNGRGTVTDNYALFGSIVPDEPYRIVTSGFLHYGLFHLAFNMYALYILGQLLEPALGWPRFVAIYFASLLAGSLGVIILEPNTLAAGASGAIFGLFAAAFIILRARGMAAEAGQIGFIIVINLFFTLSIPGISIGAHLFGAAGGALCALVVLAGDRGKLGARRVPVEIAAIAALGIVAAVVSIAIA